MKERQIGYEYHKNSSSSSQPHSPSHPHMVSSNADMKSHLNNLMSKIVEKLAKESEDKIEIISTEIFL